MSCTACSMKIRPAGSRHLPPSPAPPHMQAAQRPDHPGVPGMPPAASSLYRCAITNVVAPTLPPAEPLPRGRRWRCAAADAAAEAGERRPAR